MCKNHQKHAVFSIGFKAYVLLPTSHERDISPERWLNYKLIAPLQGMPGGQQQGAAEGVHGPGSAVSMTFSAHFRRR